MGPNIKRFYIEGAVKDEADLANKQMFEEARLKKRMASSGHIPVLDITPLVETCYDEVKGTTRYAITMYGVEVESDAWKYEGWLNGQSLQLTTKTQFEAMMRRENVFS